MTITQPEPASAEAASPTRWRAYVALALGVFCIGCSAIFVKLAGVSGPASAFYRIAIAAVALLPWWATHRAAAPARRDVAWIVVGAAFFALDLMLWNSALLLTSAATATLLANNAPVWVGLGAWLIWGERLGGRFWLGLAMSLAGMATIVGPEALAALRPGGGEAMAVAASLFYAVYLLTTGRVRARVDTVTFMMLSVAASAVVLLAACLALGVPLAGFSAGSWAALLGLGLVSQLGGWLAINFALGHLPTSAVSVTLLGQALVTALLSIPILGEVPGLAELAGGGLVLAGIYLVNRRA